MIPFRGIISTSNHTVNKQWAIHTYICNKISSSFSEHAVKMIIITGVLLVIHECYVRNIIHFVSMGHDHVAPDECLWHNVWNIN